MSASAKNLKLLEWGERDRTNRDVLDLYNEGLYRHLLRKSDRTVTDGGRRTGCRPKWMWMEIIKE